MSEALPDPLVPPEVDLRDFTYMPVDIVRLFGSDFHAQSSDGEWRAGMTLWLKSFHQVPGGSVPAGEIALARLAEFGRDLQGWQAVQAGALHGWTLCNDNRWYHKVVCEKALEGWIGKLLQRRSGAVGNAKRWGTPADIAQIDRMLSDAAQALQRLAPGSLILRKCRLGQAAEGAPTSPSDSAQKGSGSQADHNPIAPQSVPDRDPIAEGSQEITKGEGKLKERESREGATTPPDFAGGPKQAPKRGRSSKSLIPLPPEFVMTAEMREYATKHGFDPNWLFEKFQNKAIAKGWTYKDWPAAFRNFAQTEQTYATAYRSNGARQDQTWRPPDV